EVDLRADDESHRDAADDRQEDVEGVEIGRMVGGRGQECPRRVRHGRGAEVFGWDEEEVAGEHAHASNSAGDASTGWRSRRQNQAKKPPTTRTVAMPPYRIMAMASLPYRPKVAS